MSIKRNSSIEPFFPSLLANIKREVEEKKTEEKKTRKHEIAEKYVELCKKLGRPASRAEAINSGITNSSIENVFGNITGLQEYAKDHFPNSFSAKDDIRIYNAQRKQEITSTIEKHRTFIVSYAREGATVNNDFYNAIKNYNKKNNSKLLLFAENNNIKNIDKKLANENFVLANTSLNQHLTLITVKTPATCVNPLTKLEEYSRNGESILIGHPRQELETIAKHRDADALPRIKFSTGAITETNYDTEDPVQSRQNSFAELAHVCGGFVVENGTGSEFHVRNIIANEDGSFYDLGNLYIPNGKVIKTKDQIEKPAIVFPDLHWGDHSEVALQTFERLAKEVGADTVILHDVHDFRTINHHESNQQVTRAFRFQNGDGLLQEELDSAKFAYDRFAEQFEKVIVVKSNHDNFLIKYLNEGVIQEQNRFVCSRLIGAMGAYRIDPLVWYYTKNDDWTKCIKYPDKVKWLDEDSIEKIYRVTISKHGHKGKNGSRNPSVQSMVSSYERVVFGHTHCPKIKREGYVVGYMGGEHEYAKGDASGWMITAAVIYPTGAVQLVTCVNGKYAVNDIKPGYTAKGLKGKSRRKK
jgi:predicted phosphodiesterase